MKAAPRRGDGETVMEARAMNRWNRVERLARRRKRREGMTLIEIMIVVIIMAMIAAAVGMAVLPALERSRVRQARSDAMTVRSAAEMYLAEDATADCPTVQDLVDAHVLNSAARLTDPWGNDFTIRCDGTDITVTSDGLTDADGDDGDDD